jgi:peptidoglycan/LPS O-acetylase OafA/YrhL
LKSSPVVEVEKSVQAPARYLTLDALRGVAALLVVAMHAGMIMGRETFLGAYLAVDFFFILSGFVIAAAYGRGLTSSMTKSEFIRRRLVRLWPLFALGIGLNAALYGFSLLLGADRFHASLAVAAGLGLLMAPLRISLVSDVYPVNPPSWSLFFELVANLVYALLASRLTTRRLAAFVGVAALALVTTALHFGSLGVGQVWPTFIGGFARVGFGFFAGVLLYRLSHGRVISSNLCAIGLAAVLAAVLMGSPHLWWTDLIAALAVFPLLVLVSAKVQPRGHLLAPAAWLGRMSYAIYILHIPVVRFTIWAAKVVLGPAVPAGVMFALVVAAVLATAGLADRLWDAPIRRCLINQARGGFRLLGRDPQRTLGVG